MSRPCRPSWSDHASGPSPHSIRARTCAFWQCPSAIVKLRSPSASSWSSSGRRRAGRGLQAAKGWTSAGSASMSVDRRRCVTTLALAVSIALASSQVPQGRAAQDARQPCLAAPTATCLFAEAERIASTIGDVSMRAMTLAKIAVEYANASVENAALRARVTLLRARLAVPEPDAAPADLLGFAWSNIARAEVQLGYSDAALETVAGISDPHMRAAALVSIAGIQAAANDVVGALLTAARIDDADYHAVALGEIARSQAEAGSLAASLATAKAIGPAFWRDRALLNVALTSAHTGRLNRALEAAEGIGHAPFRAWVDSLVAAKAGNLEGALRIASSMDESRADALGDVAQALAEGGDVVGGLRIANSMEDVHDRVAALASIAEAQADRDDIAGALRTCRTMENALRPLELRARAVAAVPMRLAVADVAVKQAISGEPAGAILTATAFLGGSDLTEALARVAAAISRNE